jgi:hypothetical protein
MPELLLLADDVVVGVVVLYRESFVEAPVIVVS